MRFAGVPAVPRRPGQGASSDRTPTTQRRLGSGGLPGTGRTFTLVPVASRAVSSAACPSVR
jgi:hypothetical protein